MSTLNIFNHDNTIELDDNAQSTIEKEVNTVAIGVMMTMAALIGVWGIACIFCGLAGSEGITDFAQSWITAVTGR